MNQFANKCVGEQEIANRIYFMYIDYREVLHLENK